MTQFQLILQRIRLPDSWAVCLAWALIIGISGFMALSQFVDPFAPLVLLLPLLLVTAFGVRVPTLLFVYLAYVPLHISIFKNTEVGEASAGMGPFSAFGMLKDLLLFAVFGVWLARLLAGEKRLALPGSKALLLLLGYIGWAAVHVCNFTDLKTGFWGLRSAMEFSIVAMLAAAALKSPRDLKTALWIVSLTALPMIGYGFFQLSTGNIMYVIGPEVTTLAGRLTGGFGDMYSTNAYGTYLLITVLASYGLLAITRNSAGRILLLASLTAAGINLLFTFSRRSWVACFLGIALYALFHKRWRVMIVLGMAVIVAIIAYPDMVLDRLASIVSLTDSSNAGRIAEWSEIMDRTTANPLLPLWGLGFGLIGPTGMDFNVPGAVNSHSNFVLIYGQLGIVGLAVFLSIIFLAARDALRVRKRIVRTEEAHMIEILIVCLASLSFTALFGITFESFPSSFYFWLILGALIAVSASEKNKEAFQIQDDSAEEYNAIAWQHDSTIRSEDESHISCPAGTSRGKSH